MTDSLRFFVIVDTFYCFACLGGEDLVVAHEYPLAEEIVGEDYADGGFYCCNCGRDSDQNKDANAPGHAVYKDFEYDDWQAYVATLMEEAEPVIQGTPMQSHRAQAVFKA